MAQLNPLPVEHEVLEDTQLFDLPDRFLALLYKHFDALFQESVKEDAYNKFALSLFVN